MQSIAVKCFSTISFRRYVFLASSGLRFDHLFLVKIDACTWKTSLTTVNQNDKPKSWGSDGDFTGQIKFMQSLFFSVLEERNKSGSARKVLRKLFVTWWHVFRALAAGYVFFASSYKKVLLGSLCCLGLWLASWIIFCFGLLHLIENHSNRRRLLLYIHSIDVISSISVWILQKQGKPRFQLQRYVNWKKFRSSVSLHAKVDLHLLTELECLFYVLYTLS